jgi:hypothetical protein
MMRRLALAALVLSLLPQASRAGDYVHTVAAGETLGFLATQYYGAAWKAVYLETRNNLPSGKEPAAGTRLVVPASFIYRVRRGDSLAAIAKRDLGDLERYKAIMQENGIKETSELEPERELLLPFHLHVTVAQGESLTQIARRLYHASRKAGLLKDYNGGSEPKPGDKIIVPIFDRATLDPQTRRPAPPKTARPAVAEATPPRPTRPAIAEATPPRPDAPVESVVPAAPAVAASAATQVAPPAPPAPLEAADGRPRADDQAPMPATVTALDRAATLDRATLAAALSDLQHGEFARACPALERLLAARGPGAMERAPLLRHLGVCAVAFGDNGAARDYFRKWLELVPSAQLDPVATSPKILRAFNEARAAASDSRRSTGAP